MWDAVHGLRRLDQSLSAMGYDTTEWTFDTATGVSSDGRVIVGSGTHSLQPAAYRIVLPDAFVDTVAADR